MTTVHMVGTMPMRLKEGRTVTTRCGLKATVLERSTELTYRTMTARGVFLETTTRRDLVTCQKCNGLINTGQLLQEETHDH